MCRTQSDIAVSPTFRKEGKSCGKGRSYDNPSSVKQGMTSGPRTMNAYKYEMVLLFVVSFLYFQSNRSSVRRLNRSIFLRTRFLTSNMHFHVFVSVSCRDLLQVVVHFVTTVEYGNHQLPKRRCRSTKSWFSNKMVFICKFLSAELCSCFDLFNMESI